MKRNITTIISLVIIFFSLTPTVHAASASVLKARMEKRLPIIVSLKKRGLIGENNKGYLTVRGSLTSAQKSAVIAENADRRAVYGIIAAKAKTSAVSVGKTRAASIRKSAPAGTWIQLTNGSWKKKTS